MDRQFAKYQQALTSKSLELETQQRENFELKEEIDRLQAALSSCKSSTTLGRSRGADQEVVIVPTSTPPQDKPFPFLELPAELRIAICELCLVQKTVCLTHASSMTIGTMRFSLLKVRNEFYFVLIIKSVRKPQKYSFRTIISS